MGRRESDEKYRREHREVLRKRQRKYRERLIREGKLDGHQHYLKYREMYKRNARKWAKKNPEKVKNIQRRYIRKHRDEINKRQRKYRRENREKIRSYPSNSAKKHREYRKKIKKEIFELLGGKCVRCGFSDWRALQIDHVKGGGKKEINSMSYNVYSRMVLIKIKAGSKDYQLLCANCNWIKRYEERELRSNCYSD